MTPEELLHQGLETLGWGGLSDPEQGVVLERALLSFADLLTRWNRTYNLTAVRDPLQMISHHLLDALSIARHIGPGPILDVGSGGGLPGIPLALLYPERSFTLVDSNTKKTAFLQQAKIELGLQNLHVVACRIEAFPLSRRAAPAGFAQITSRAFASLADFVTLSEPLLAPGGEWLAMKGVHPDQEPDALRSLPGSVVIREVHRLHVPYIEAERHLVVLARKENT